MINKTAFACSYSIFAGSLIIIFFLIKFTDKQIQVIRPMYLVFIIRMNYIVVICYFSHKIRYHLKRYCSNICLSCWCYMCNFMNSSSIGTFVHLRKAIKEKCYDNWFFISLVNLSTEVFFFYKWKTISLLPDLAFVFPLVIHA